MFCRYVHLDMATPATDRGQIWRSIFDFDAISLLTCRHRRHIQPNMSSIFIFADMFVLDMSSTTTCLAAYVGNSRSSRQILGLGAPWLTRSAPTTTCRRFRRRWTWRPASCSRSAWPRARRSPSCGSLGISSPTSGCSSTPFPILEARASSAIENIVTTNDALFRQASLGDSEATPATKEAARYRTALYRGVEALKTLPLSTRIAVDVCRVLTGIEMDVRRTPGTTLANSHTGEVIYTPPEGEGAPARAAVELGDVRPRAAPTSTRW